MPLSLHTNIASLTASRAWGLHCADASDSVARLSSGLRVNSALDDAAGLAIATRHHAQASGIEVALRNVADAYAIVQQYESVRHLSLGLFQRMRELAVQAASGGIGNPDRSALNTEFQALVSEFNRTTQGARFGAISLFPAMAGTMDFQVGPNNGDTITINVPPHVAFGGCDVSTQATAAVAIALMDNMLGATSGNAAVSGAILSRLDMATRNLSTLGESLRAAQGRIIDADFAQESSALSRAQILHDASAAMVAKANVQPSQVLRVPLQA